MTHQSRTHSGQEVLTTIGRLVTAADGDTLYRDVYLRRAAALLSPVISEKQYELTVSSRQQLARLLSQARAAVTRQDWPEVRELGKRAADLQHFLASDQASLSAAETVYGASFVMLDPLSPGLTSLSKRWSSAEQARAETRAALAELARDDPQAGEMYVARQRALDALFVQGLKSADAPVRATDPVDVEQRALQAIQQGDGAALQRLAESHAGRREGRERRGPTCPTRTHCDAGCPERALSRRLPPEGQSARARATRVEAPNPELVLVITEFVERYAPSASASTFELARDGVVRVKVAAEAMKIPADVAAVLGDMVSLLALHLYVNSAGLRYFPPPTPRESILRETHREGDEPLTPLLQELGLQQRRGLARDDIETALSKQGPRVLAEGLGLDPTAFRPVCVPPDVFARVGRERGWGNREQWTHYDGYRVASGGHLRALVGGNARYGGLLDLCSISRDDGRENTVARFAVIRRERLGIRIA